MLKLVFLTKEKLMDMAAKDLANEMIALCELKREMDPMRREFERSELYWMHLDIMKKKNFSKYNIMKYWGSNQVFINDLKKKVEANS